MLIFLLGWLSLIGVAFNSFLFFLNVFKPLQNERRVKFHCNVGLTSLVSTTGHIFLLFLEGYGYESMIWLGFGLYLLILASGAVLFYLPSARGLRYQARSFHPALVIGLVITLLFHILNVLSF
jgi:hypothetical protein